MKDFLVKNQPLIVIFFGITIIFILAEILDNLENIRFYARNIATQKEQKPFPFEYRPVQSKADKTKTPAKTEKSDKPNKSDNTDKLDKKENE